MKFPHYFNGTPYEADFTDSSLAYDFRENLIVSSIKMHHPNEVNYLSAGAKHPITGQTMSHYCVLKYYGISLDSYWRCCLEAGRVLGEEDINA